MYLLGYDLGSSTIKAALIEADTQKVVGLVQYPDQDMDMISRRSGWAEQQPEIWWKDLCMATKKLLRQTQAPPQRIRAIGIGYQMHGLVLIDKDKQVLRPAIIWCDSRAVEIGHQAFREIGESYCLNSLLNSPGNFTASRLKWVKDHEPDIYNRIHKILLPGDYIAMKLTGRPVTTVSGLTEGIFWDFEYRKVSDKVLRFFGFEADILPETVPTFSIQGRLTRTAAEMTGLAPGTPVSYRAGDQPNNALALNVMYPGEVAATSGTSGVVYGIVDQPIVDPESRINSFAHVNYEQNFDRIGVLLCLNGAGITYHWIKHQVARDGQHYHDMERMAASVPIGADGLYILPFGNGAERILNNKNVNSHIFNLQFNRHTRGHLYRAALEGVAFSFVYGVNMLKEMGLNVDVIRVGNDNMFQSKIFSMTIATLLDSHIEVVNTTGAIGAAQAAGVGSGIYHSLEEALGGIKPNTIYEPRLNLAHCNQAYNYWLSGLNQVVGGNANAGAQNIKILKSKNEKLSQNLKQKNKELYEQSLQVVGKTELLNEIKEQLESITKESDSNKKEQLLRKLAQKVDQKSGQEKEWQKLEEHFDLLNHDLCKRLRHFYPKLSMTDLKLCIFLSMQLPTKEIADRLNLSVRGVETRRYRLRKKMDLEKGTNLVRFLDAF